MSRRPQTRFSSRLLRTGLIVLLASFFGVALAGPAMDEREAGLRQVLHVPAKAALRYEDEKGGSLTLDQFMAASARGREFTKKNDVAHQIVTLRLTAPPPAQR